MHHKNENTNDPRSPSPSVVKAGISPGVLHWAAPKRQLSLSTYWQWVRQKSAGAINCRLKHVFPTQRLEQQVLLLPQAELEKMAQSHVPSSLAFGWRGYRSSDRNRPRSSMRKSNESKHEGLRARQTRGFEGMQARPVSLY